MGSQLFTTPVDTNIQWDWVFGVTTVVAEGIGGGGGGGEAQGNPSRGGGGKGGGYAKTTVTKGAEVSLQVLIGSGGANSANGAFTRVSQNVTNVLIAPGGNGAAIVTGNGANGAGATAANGTAVGDTTFAGGNGGTSTGTPSGAGGGSAGPTSAGGNASGGTAGATGTGNFGDGVNYSSAGAAGAASGSVGTAAPSSGTDYGGGGSGGFASGAANRNGGAGRQGVVLLSWTDPPALVAADLSQDAFGFFADDAGAISSTALAATNTNISWDGASDLNLQLRFRIQDTSGGTHAGVPSDDWQLYVSKTGAGYAASPTDPVANWNSPNLTDNADVTTNRLGSGSGSFMAGRIAETGLMNNYQFGLGRYTEHLWAVTLTAAQVTAGDTIDFQMRFNGTALGAYTVTPRVTVSGGAPAGQPIAKRSGGTPFMNKGHVDGVQIW